ncbi:MAG: efflux RND transporter periplasmic adaptor subunit [Gemmatimonadota bacterium]|nr:efflux RND transporter periplasmic adaptor subunit [Gemmatimonadota bacterium]MDH5282343.1 efflux RND transporter periplasmic adaptor subunit [Gemmatimonadota bacterium]
MRTHLPLYLAALAAAAVASCKKEPPPPPPLDVQVMTVEQSNVPLYAEYTGQTRGSVELEVRARVEGILQKQHYKDGSEVKKGELLFTIDPANYQAKLTQAQSQMAEAQATLTRATNDVNRFRPLAEKKAIPQQTLDNALSAEEAAQAGVAAAKANVDQTRLDLSYTRISAEASGLAGKAEVLPGNFVGRGEPTLLTRISQLDPIRVRFSVPEQEMIRIQRELGVMTQEQRKARFSGAFEMELADGSRYPQKGDLVFGDRQVDPNTGTLLVEVEFPNPGRTMRPGQFARVRFLKGALDSAIVVPQRAVRELQGTFRVAVVDDSNRVFFRQVESPSAFGSVRVITTGLKSGERIIVEGLQRVRDSVVVNPKPWTPPPDSAAARPDTAKAPAAAPATN